MLPLRALVPAFPVAPPGRPAARVRLIASSSPAPRSWIRAVSWTFPNVAAHMRTDSFERDSGLLRRMRGSFAAVPAGSVEVQRRSVRMSASETTPADANPADSNPARPDDQDFDKAIAEFSKAIELKPYAADAFYGRALAYQCKRAFPEAIADYDRVIALDPGHADAHFKRSIVHRQLGAFEKATADFDRAVQLLWRQQVVPPAKEP
ncbi:tetratricopeptide repeat protein [Labrys sp. KNU-23]|nr:tetratricopeptide repeat protein [Labrys sp. KNU-23]